MASPVYTVEYEFAPEDIVWVVNSCTVNTKTHYFVISGTVARVVIKILADTTSIEYDVVLADDNGTTSFPEENVYADKDSALAAYSALIEA